MGRAKIFVNGTFAFEINRRPSFLSGGPAFKSESISLRARIFSIGNILTRAMSGLELYLFTGMPLYWIFAVESYEKYQLNIKAPGRVIR